MKIIIVNRTSPSIGRKGIVLNRNVQDRHFINKIGCDDNKFYPLFILDIEDTTYHNELLDKIEQIDDVEGQLLIAAILINNNKIIASNKESLFYTIHNKVAYE